jgi:hypothetical protein
MQAGSLSRHLADLHEIYQGQVVAEELLNQHEGVVYKVKERNGKLKCPSPLCTGELAGGWMMQRHFCDMHPLDYITVPSKGGIPMVPMLWDAGLPMLPGTYQHEKVPGGDGEMPPGGHGSAISACFA